MKLKLGFVVIFYCIWVTNSQALSINEGEEEIPPIPQPAAIADNLLQLLLDIRDRMHMEIPSLGLPILEPAKVDDRIELNLESGTIGLLKGSFEKLTIVGLQGLVPNDVDFKLAGFPFLFNLTVPQLSINGLFTIDSILGNMLPVTGEGDVNINITNLQLFAKGRLRFGSDIWTVPELDLIMSLDKLDTKFNGLYGGNNEYEDFINLAMTELGANILNEIFPEFKQTFIDLVIEVAEGALEGKTVLDLVNIMNGNIELPPLD